MTMNRQVRHAVLWNSCLCVLWQRKTNLFGFSINMVIWLVKDVSIDIVNGIWQYWIAKYFLVFSLN